MLYLRVILLSLSLLVGFSQCVNGQEVKWIYGEWPSAEIDQLALKGKLIASMQDRLDFISSQFLNTPYKGNTLIGSTDELEQLVVNLAGMDCFTFVDYVVALALSKDGEDFVSQLVHVRYEGGQIHFQKRNHFFAQWIQNNEAFGNSCSTSSQCRCDIRKLNRKKDGSLWVPGIPAKEYSVCFVPRKTVLPDIEAFVRAGDIVGFCTSLAGLDVSHTGFAFRKGNELVLRHASSKAGKIVDESLRDYLVRQKRSIGLIVARPCL